MIVSTRILESTEPAFRRRIVIVSEGGAAATRVRAALEDDFHHFRVEVRCVEGRVEQVAGEAPRHPYTLCNSAAGELAQLVGMPVGAIAHAVTRQVAASEQCTHLLELAGLAIAAAARGMGRRQYDIVVPDRNQDGRTAPTLWRDGAPMIEWTVTGDSIDGPAPYGGINLRAGLARWALETLPAEEAEAALVLRRCTAIAIGRTKNLDAESHARPTGFCYSQQPRRAEQAIRVVKSTLDFSASAELLCAGDDTWLRFAGPG